MRVERLMWLSGRQFEDDSDSDAVAVPFHLGLGFLSVCSSSRYVRNYSGLRCDGPR
jgi:hypothetical protein